VINAYLNQIGTFVNTVLGAYQEPAFVFSFDVPVRILSKKRRIVTDIGVETFSEKIVLMKSIVLASGFEVDLSWTILFDGFEWPIITIEEKRHLSAEFFELTLGTKVR
jgi:hypothetical protein